MNTHPISNEQVMAFLDDQLPAGETKAVAQHVSDCWECQVLLADLKSVSGTLRTWTIEEPQSELCAPAIPVKRSWLMGWRVWAAGAAAVTVLAVGAIYTRRAEEPGEARYDKMGLEVTQRDLPADRLEVLSGAQGTVKTKGAALGVSPVGSPEPAYSPMVVRTAELALTATRFDPARADLERIAKMHGGFVADLWVTSASGQARSLRATLRVPSAQLDATLNELRLLGHVDSEAQRGEDVTRQYVDVTARIANLRETEQRLTTILRERTGRLSDVLAVEEQIDRTRGQIETAEAEEKSLSNQVSLATVQVSVGEVYHARLDGKSIGIATRIRNAAVDGTRLLRDAIVGVLLWLLSYGPVLLLVVVILFWPVCLAWKRMRT